MTTGKPDIRKFFFGGFVLVLVAVELFFYFSLVKEKKLNAVAKKELSEVSEKTRVLQTDLDAMRSEKQSLEEIVIQMKNAAESKTSEIDSAKIEFQNVQLQIRELNEKIGALETQNRLMADRMGLRARKIRKTIDSLSKIIAEERAQVYLGSIVMAQKPESAPEPPPKPKTPFKLQGKNSVKATVVAVNPEFHFVVAELSKPFLFKAKDKAEILTEAGDTELTHVEMTDRSFVVLSSKDLSLDLQFKDQLILTKK